MRRVAVLALIAAVAGAALSGCGGGDGGQAPAGRTATAPEQVANGPAAGTAPATAPPVHVAPSRKPVPVLMYHVIAAAPAGAKYAGLWVAPAAFRAQVAALRRAGYEAVTLDTALAAWRGRARLPAHPVVLSFDDGYLSQGRDAGAILHEVGWPGVLNLAWHNLGVPGGLSSGRVRALIDDGWEIDAHSLTHPDLTTLGPAALRREVAGSRAEIRRRFGVPADAFCYPAGRFDPAVEAAVRAAGYRAATTELPGAARPSGDPFALPRIRVDAGDSATAVVGKVRAAVGSAA